MLPEGLLQSNVVDENNTIQINVNLTIHLNEIFLGHNSKESAGTSI